MRARDCNVFPEPMMSLSQLLCPVERSPRNEPETWEEANTLDQWSTLEDQRQRGNNHPSL